MTAAVEQHHIAGLRLFQAVQQAVEIQRVVGGVVVGVFQHFGPTALKTFLWFGQLGLLIQMRLALVWLAIKSAATRRPPVPPGVCAVRARRSATIGLSLPNNSSCVQLANAGMPSIPR